MSHLNANKKSLLFIVPLIFFFNSVLSATPSEFPRTCLTVGNRTIEVRVAKVFKDLQTGLSGIPRLGEDDGMLFILPRKSKPNFHMKNVVIPLSIAFIDERGNILKIEHMNTENSDKIYPPPDQTRYALEMNAGWFEKNGVKVGNVINGNRKKLKNTEHCPTS